MFLNLAPGAISVTATFDETIAIAKKHNFAGIDLPLGDAALKADPTAYAGKLAAAGLKWGGFGLPMDFRRDQKTYDDGIAKLRELAPLARKVNCTRCVTWIMPRHDTLDFNANMAEHASRLRLVAKILADNGVRFGVEFVGPKTLRTAKYEFIHDIDGALQLADAIGSNTGVLLDSFHWYCSRGAADDIAVKLRGKVVYVHVNDGRAGRGPDEQIDNERALPTETGVIDLKAFLASVRKSGFDGPITAEPFMPELGKVPADQAVARVAASMKKMLAL